MINSTQQLSPKILQHNRLFGEVRDWRFVIDSQDYEKLQHQDNQQRKAKRIKDLSQIFQKNESLLQGEGSDLGQNETQKNDLVEKIKVENKNRIPEKINKERQQSLDYTPKSNHRLSKSLKQKQNEFKLPELSKSLIRNHPDINSSRSSFKKHLKLKKQREEENLQEFSSSIQKDIDTLAQKKQIIFEKYLNGFDINKDINNQTNDLGQLSSKATYLQGKNQNYCKQKVQSQRQNDSRSIQARRCGDSQIFEQHQQNNVYNQEEGGMKFEHYLFKIKPNEQLKQSGYNMFQESIEKITIPQEIKIDQNEVKKAMRSSFYRNFSRTHRQNINNQIQTIKNSLNNEDSLRSIKAMIRNRQQKQQKKNLSNFSVSNYEY